MSPTEPVAETAPAPAGDAPQPVQPVAAQAEQPAQPTAAPRVASATSYKAPSSSNPALDASFLGRTVDVLEGVREIVMFSAGFLTPGAGHWHAGQHI